MPLNPKTLSSTKALAAVGLGAIALSILFFYKWHL
jgi:hypothetical protein